MAITCKKITFDLLVKLGKKFGYLNFKGYSMDALTECWQAHCKDMELGFEFEDEQDLHYYLNDFLMECRINDQQISDIYSDVYYSYS